MPAFGFLRNEQDVRTFTAGDVVFREGEVGECMFLVLEGEVEIRRGGRVLETVGEDSVFGELALIDQAPRSATAVAARDCRLAAIGQQRFVALVQRTPFFAIDIMQVLAERLRRSTSS